MATDRSDERFVRRALILVTTLAAFVAFLGLPASAAGAEIPVKVAVIVGPVGAPRSSAHPLLLTIHLDRQTLLDVEDSAIPQWLSQRDHGRPGSSDVLARLGPEPPALDDDYDDG